MKKITLISILLISVALASCDGMGPKVNSNDCTERLDVQFADGSAMWVYNGSVSSGYVKGNDEMGQRVWVSMNQVLTVTEVDCGNGR
jgi:hypothetical protein